MPITQILLTANSGPGGGGSPNAYAGYGTTPVEGSTTTVTITVENWTGDRVYWTVVGKGDLPTNPSTDMTGTLSGFWDPGATSFAQTVVTTIGFVADDGTEGTEYWGVDLGSTEGGNDYYSSNAWPIEEPSPPPADFTIEWWQKVDNGGGSSPRPWSVGLYPTQQVALSYEGKISDYFWINNSYINATSQDHRSQGWRHMAYVRDSGVLKGYINGTQYTPNITSTQQITGTTIPLYVGTGEAGAGNFNGYITNLHIMKGHAKYTGNFTATTTPTVPTVSSVFLIPAQNNVTPYFDITNTPHGVTAAVGSPTWNSDTPFTAPTAAGPYTRYNNSWGGVGGQYAGTIDFGSGNDDLLNIKRGWIVTDGTNTGYVINDAYQPFGADAVRIEITFTPTDPATYTFTQYQVGGSLYFNGSSYLNYGASADWAFDFVSPTYTLTPATTSTNEGSAITFNVTGTNIVNGTYYWTIQTNSSDFATTSSSFTITNNTGSFTVTPSADVTTEGAETFTVAIRSDSNTGTILSTSTSVTINDTSLTKLQLTSGQALGFNGVDNRRVVIADNLADWNLGDNWTIEWWQKIPGEVDGFLSVLCQDANVDPYSGIDVFVNAGNICMFNGNLNFAEAAATRDEWNHIAIQKNGTTLAAYINGVAQTLGGSHPGTIAPSSPLNVVIGSRTSDGGANFYDQYFNGELANIRISDIARYSTTFTPPTTVSSGTNTVLALDGSVGGGGMLVDETGRHTLTNNGATIVTIT